MSIWIDVGREKAAQKEAADRAYRFRLRHPDWAGDRYGKSGTFNAERPGDRCPSCGSNHTWRTRSFKVQQRRACDTCGNRYLAPRGAAP